MRLSRAIEGSKTKPNKPCQRRLEAALPFVPGHALGLSFYRSLNRTNAQGARLTTTTMSHSKRTVDIRKPYSGLSRSLVIAIDVGTTFSGVRNQTPFLSLTSS
jgi:hypothetical protein